MTIIEIKQTRQGEVAYILDEQRGRVVKVLVEDLTQAEYAEDERYEEPPAPRRVPVRMPSQQVRRPRPPVIDDGLEDADGLEDSHTPKPKLPIKPKPSIIPPHLAGVFQQPDKPGAAVESRTV